MVRKWYGDAASLTQTYQVNSLPAFLFFSPDGKPVNKATGLRTAAELIGIGKDAQDTSKQYYAKLEAFKNSRLQFNEMPALIDQAWTLRESKAANELSKFYVDNYLLDQQDAKIYTSANLKLIAGLVKSSTERGFNVFYGHEAKVDSALKVKDFSLSIVDPILYNEEIDKRLYNSNTALTDHPDWDDIKRIIAEKYNSVYADRLVLMGKIYWFGYKKQWDEYCKAVILRVETYGPYDQVKPFNNYKVPLGIRLNTCMDDFFV